jgi:hypothetical protein
MSCNETWSYEDVIKMFDKTFITKRYKKHREEMLLSRERSLMPATQPLVEIYIQSIKNKNTISMHIEHIQELQKQISIIHKEIYNLERRNSDQDDVKQEKRAFIRKCTYTECLGYLSPQWKCGLCENWSCPRCYEVIGDNKEEHECDPDTLATATLIKQDTRLCPKCSMGIFKISGCDVMFCTDCHTSFNWKTNRIITGAAHNPHHMEWLMTRPAGRNNNAVLCGREIDPTFTYLLINKLFQYAHISQALWRNRCRHIIHIVNIEIPRYNNNIVINNQDLRIKLMAGEIDEEKFKMKIHKREKDCNKKQAIYNIMTMFTSCQTDIIYRLYDALQDYMEIDDIIVESDELLAYANECLINNARIYNIRPRLFNDEFWLE